MAAELPFTDRDQAGHALARALGRRYPCADLLVLALPRGGVPVAAVVAEELGAPLDLMLVRKLGVPGQEELAMGAIASGGARVMNQDILDVLPIGEAAIARVVEREQRELERREQAYRGERPAPPLAGRTVVLVDDGVATGATMRAAVQAVRQYRPRAVVVAVPVAPPETVEVLGGEADEVVCLATPEPFMGVGRWYRDFAQTSDAQVRQLLARAWDRQPATSRSQPGDSP